MKKASTVFLQIVVMLIGCGALAVLLIEPIYEGRNVHSTLFQVYFKDPFLVYAYTGSIAFFIALYQAFKLLNYARRNEIISLRAVKALRTIKYCGMVIIGFLLGAEVYFFLMRRGSDDIAGGVMMGLVIIFMSVIVAAASAISERTMQSAVELKSENDLTV